MKRDKPREWSIDLGTAEIVPPGKATDFDVHVVETSAYLAEKNRADLDYGKLQAERDALKAKLAECVDALFEIYNTTGCTCYLKSKHTLQILAEIEK